MSTRAGYAGTLRAPGMPGGWQGRHLDSLPVSTPESFEAHVKRIAARELLAQVTRDLIEANDSMFQMQ